MEARRKPLSHRPCLARQQAQPGIDPVGWRMQFGIKHHVAAMDAFFRNAVADQVERAAIAGTPAIRRLVLGMQ